jgi:hypothetical protein
MKISELCYALQKISETEGDLEVVSSIEVPIESTAVRAYSVNDEIVQVQVILE